jgi:hypothetical protein
MRICHRVIGKVGIVIYCVTSLFACGDGSDHPVATAEGAYAGTLSGSTSQPNFRSLILENGQFWSLYGFQSPTSFEVVGFVEGSGTSNVHRFPATFASSDTKDFGFNPAWPVTVNATYSATSIRGTIDASFGIVNFNGTTIESPYTYNIPAVNSTIVGVWSTKSLTGETVAINIAANGGFTAVSGLGCNFSGTITPRSSGKNVFDVALTFAAAPCASPNQSFTGIAIAYPQTLGQTQLVVAVVDSGRTIGAAVFGTR